MQKLLISTLLCASLVSACSVHKLEIQQGNVVTTEMLEKLKPGMTARQVKFVMGSPQLNDPFEKNRWDYIHTFREEGEEVERKHLTLYFEDEILTRIIDNSANTSAAKP
ncbi:outer membrane protein assembly factor BamE [Pseudomonadota bacterium]